MLLTCLLAASCGGGGSGDVGTGTSPPPTGGGSSTPAQPTDILTYKYDAMRSGANVTESVLTTQNVNSTSFGLLRFLPTDGKVDAQPLYLSGLSISGASHNVVYVATENDSVYAFDADTGTQLWQVSLLGAGESPSDPVNCGQVTPTIGITSTPVIDPAAGAHGTLFVVAMSKSGSSYFQRLHALDVTTGAELLNGPVPISASYPVSGGTMTFQPENYEERAALLLSQGTIYTSWTSHCDQGAYSGWVIAYSESALTQTAVFNAAPNSGQRGPAIWMAGGGPAADPNGHVYLLTANGGFETTLDSGGFPNQGDYGNSFLKLTLSGGTLAVADYFAMYNEVSESAADQDLGSGGILLLPDLTDSSGTARQLAVGAGKDGNLYVVDRNSMGKFSASTNNIFQELDGVLGGGIWSTPAYFNNTVYYGPSGGQLVSFGIAQAKLAPASQSSAAFEYPGTAPSVSANATAEAIVWAHENSDPAVLHAYAAGNLGTELYNSSQAGSRDQFGAGNKFITPVVADGKVFVGSVNGVAVFGLLGN
ncbi:MAG TPA: PQQ-binding-like beta-propeller repeat protein [Steroidobacteraceae bacterium]|nr:PQQ-binding-like beta-propeller repeat protein [Steroidobacteraceae bacterium]